MNPGDEATDDDHLRGATHSAEAHEGAGNKHQHRRLHHGAFSGGPTHNMAISVGVKPTSVDLLSQRIEIFLEKSFSASPAEASDQHTHDDGAQQAPDGEDRHGEGVHEGQGLFAQSRPVAAHHRLVVKVFDVLQRRDKVGERSNQASTTRQESDMF